MTTLIPVTITERHRSRCGRLEVWAAVSAGGQWTFSRTEDPGTPWIVQHAAMPGELWYGSLPKARCAVADGSAMQELADQAAKEAALWRPGGRN